MWSSSKYFYKLRSTVIYWPSTEPSIKRCTCVNTQKNSGSRWTLENNNQVPGLVCVSWRQDAKVRTSSRQRALGPEWPPVDEDEAKMKKCCYGWGRTWFNIVVRPCLHSFLTHNKHHLFKNKVWEIYIKKCIRSLLKSSLSVDYVPVYICIRVVYVRSIRVRNSVIARKKHSSKIPSRKKTLTPQNNSRKTTPQKKNTLQKVHTKTTIPNLKPHHIQQPQKLSPRISPKTVPKINPQLSKITKLTPPKHLSKTKPRNHYQKILFKLSMK